MTDDDLPEFCTFQMQTEVDVDFGLDVYLDKDGHAWFADGDSIDGLPAPNLLRQEQLEAILEASREVVETEEAPEP